MSEFVKTSIYVVIAAIFAIGAFAFRPATVEQPLDDDVNKPLFEEFNDPLQAKSMQITRYDAERGLLRQFEVASTPAGWKIVSKGGYPASAIEQMAKAANSLVGLIKLGVATDLASEHAEYGVVEPDTSVAASEQEDVGQLVVIEDDSDQALARIIIGKADNQQENLRYVRVPGQDRVYVVELDPSVFSTNFEDWIEKDLLGINPFDVTSLRFRDYTLQVGGGQGVFLPKMDATLSFNSNDNKWALTALKESPEGTNQLVDSQLPEGAQLNTERLNEVRNSLDDLAIADVYPKPEGLAEALKSGKMPSPEDMPTLYGAGFYPVNLPGDDKAQIAGGNGELVVETQDAVRYRLLFGNEQLGGENRDQKQRFLFVQAELIEEQLPPPELQQVPEIKEGEGEDIEAQAAAREQILSANDAAMQAWRQRRNTAQRKIYELNARFADWYYVVSQESFDKILVSREQLTQAQGDGAQAGRAPLEGSLPGLDDPDFPGMSLNPAAGPTTGIPPALRPPAAIAPNDGPSTSEMSSAGPTTSN